MIQKTYRLWVASLLTLCSASTVAQQKVDVYKRQVRKSLSRETVSLR